MKKNFKNLRILCASRIKKIFYSIFNLVLISKSDYNTLIYQRDRSIEYISNEYNKKLINGLTIIIFSKDRAHQLYNLILTYTHAIEVNEDINIIAIIKYTSSLHERAYLKLFQNKLVKNLKIHFVIEEDTFRDSIINVLKNIKHKNLIFLVDDNIFIRKINLSFCRIINPLNEIYSLRHSPSLTYSYTTSKRQMPPCFLTYPLNPDLLEFSWFEKENEWSNPWSLDGQVLSVAEVYSIALNAKFQGPNTFESILSTYNTLCINRKGLCNKLSIILNLPLNRVQDEVQNYSGQINLDELAKNWLDGLHLDVLSLWGHVPNSPHEFHSLELIKCSH